MSIEWHVNPKISLLPIEEHSNRIVISRLLFDIYWNRYHHLVIFHCRCKLIRLKLGSFRATVSLPEERSRALVFFLFLFSTRKQWCFHIVAESWNSSTWDRSRTQQRKSRASLVSNCDWKKKVEIVCRRQRMTAFANLDLPEKVANHHFLRTCDN